MGELKNFECRTCWNRFKAPEETRICPNCKSKKIRMLKWHKDFRDPTTWTFIFVFMFFITQLIACVVILLISYSMGHHNYGSLFVVIGVATLPFVVLSYYMLIKHSPNKIIVINNGR